MTILIFGKPDLMQGAVFAKSGEEATVENVEKMFDQICDFENDSIKLNNIEDATLRVMDAIMKEESIMNKSRALPVKLFLKYFKK